LPAGIGRTHAERDRPDGREALDALAADGLLTDALGPVLAQSYLAVRRSEWDAYSVKDATFEQQGHFLKY
jgi:glutamine synthetase